MITHQQYIDAKAICEEYERRKGDSLEERKRKFVETVSIQFIHEYGEAMKTAFCSYWCEHNPKGFKMRYEMQKVFDISRRLKTWKQNERTNKADRVTQANADQFSRVLKGDL